METGYDPERPLEVGNAFADAFRAISANLGAFLAIGLITTVPATVMGLGIQLYFADQLSALQRGGDPEQAIATLWAMLGAYFAMMFVLMAIGVFGQGAAIHVTLEHMVGRKASIAGALRTATFRYIWLFLCSMIVATIVGVGAMFCLLPGLVAWIWLSAALPAVVVEEVGPITAIQRSLELTEGHRVTIALIQVALFAPYFVFTCCLSGFSGAAAGASPTGELPDPFSPGQLAMHAISFVFMLGFFMAMNAVMSVVYARLRGLHDGVDASALAKVFT